jgi:hypothetical protein
VFVSEAAWALQWDVPALPAVAWALQWAWP